MKLGLIVSALGALAVSLAAAGCGGRGSVAVGGCDGDDPSCGPPRGAGSPSVADGGGSDAGSSAHDGEPTGAASDAQAATPGVDAGGAPTSSSGGGTSSSGGGGACVPGGACGGLWECDDDCYGDACCALYCTCTDPQGQSGNLECSLECH